MGSRLSKSALEHVLKGLMPYTRQNFDLAFRPGRFFDELEQISHMRRKTLQQAARRAELDGMIIREGKLMKLTEKGLKAIKPYRPKKLDPYSRLMVIFDIPEDMATKRRRLRILLKEWKFTQEQKSVWVSSYDVGKLLVKAIRELEITSYVQVFECHRIYPKQ